MRPTCAPPQCSGGSTTSTRATPASTRRPSALSDRHAANQTATAVLRSQRATLLVWSGYPAEGAVLAEQDVANPDAGPAARARSSIAIALAWAVDGQTDAAIGAVTDGLQWASRHPDEVPVATGELLAVQACACWLGGRLADAADLAGTANRWCIEHDEHGVRGIFVLLEGQAQLGRGRVTPAVELLREATACLGRADPGRAASWGSAALAAALAQNGDAAAAAAAGRARSLARRATGLLDPLLVWAEAWAAAAMGSTSAAVDLLVGAADWCGARGMRGVEVFLLLDAIRLGGARVAAARLGRLADSQLTPTAHVALRFGRGVVDDDGSLLALASEQFEDTGALLVAAEAAFFASTAYARAGAHSSAGALAERARALHNACPGASPPTVAFALTSVIDPLTAREREVAVLAARGLSSLEVAKRLELSVRTVDNHLARTYTKLGISRRRELRLIFTPSPPEPPG